MEKISNNLLLEIIKISSSNPSYSLKDCCIELSYTPTTVYNWYKSLKEGKWPKNYHKTEDGEDLTPQIVDDFINGFSFSQNSSKILKRLVTKKCLLNSHCYGKQQKILKRLFKKYPNIDFWLTVDFGELKDDILFYIGKNEQNLDKKYIDFTSKDCYTKFEYNYKPEENTPRPVKKRNVWDFY